MPKHQVHYAVAPHPTEAGVLWTAWPAGEAHPEHFHVSLASGNPLYSRVKLRRASSAAAAFAEMKKALGPDYDIANRTRAHASLGGWYNLAKMQSVLKQIDDAKTQMDEAFKTLDDLFGELRPEVVEDITTGKRPATRRYIELLKGVTDMHELRMFDCSKIVDFTSLAELTSLERISMKACVHLDKLAPFESLVNLTEVIVGDAPKISDLSPLAELSKLEYLYLRGCTGITELTPLAGLLELETLELVNCTGITKISPLAGLLALKTLELRGCTGITELTPLAGLLELETLELVNCTGITKISPLARLLALKTLNLRNCTGITKLTPLAGLPKLEDLIIKGTGVTDTELSLYVGMLQHPDDLDIKT